MLSGPSIPLVHTLDHHTALCETGAIIPILHVRNNFRWCRQGKNSMKGDIWHGSVLKKERELSMLTPKAAYLVEGASP